MIYDTAQNSALGGVDLKKVELPCERNFPVFFPWVYNTADGNFRKASDLQPTLYDEMSSDQTMRLSAGLKFAQFRKAIEMVQQQ